MTSVEENGFDNGLADTIDDVVDEHPWLERLAQVGWIAKGIVYTLMGLTALQIARQDPTSKDASPEGSVGRVGEAPLGRALLVALTVGLLLYFLWRALSVAAIRGTSLSDWADRVGYSFSGVFYLLLAVTAGKAAVSGIDPEGSNSVERISKSVLEVTTGRWLLGAAGIATIGVGVYFAVHKGIQRSFAAHLKSVDPSPGNNEPKRAALVIAGVVGWIGRGTVTGLVGFFIVRSAVRFEPTDARGFDRSLRQVAGTGTGSMLVLICAFGLISYGIFSLMSYRFRTLKDD